MRKLIDTPNIGAASPSFPDGVIKDNAGAIVGTALTEILYGDIIQMMHKLKRLAGITENNLPDNETNGFQLITSLFAQSLPTWQPLSAKVDFSKSKWVSYANGIYYHKTTTSTDTTPNLDTTNWFRVLYWDGTKVIFSDEARIAGIEGALPSLIAHVANTTNYNNTYIDKYRPFAVGTITLPDIGGTATGALAMSGDFKANTAVVVANGAKYTRISCEHGDGRFAPTIPGRYRLNIEVQDGNSGFVNTSTITTKWAVDGTRTFNIFIRESTEGVQSTLKLHIELINTY